MSLSPKYSWRFLSMIGWSFVNTDIMVESTGSILWFPDTPCDNLELWISVLGEDSFPVWEGTEGCQRPERGHRTHWLRRRGLEYANTHTQHIAHVLQANGPLTSKAIQSIDQSECIIWNLKYSKWNKPVHEVNGKRGFQTMNCTVGWNPRTGVFPGKTWS